jgi:hypothetical protein
MRLRGKADHLGKTLASGVISIKARRLMLSGWWLQLAVDNRALQLAGAK